MKVLKIAIFLFAGLLLTMQSCYYDNEESLYVDVVNPGDTSIVVINGCDTVNVTYALTIAPLMSQSCNSCHSGTFPSAGIKTDSYTELKKYVANGRLMGSIKHSSGYSAMPQGAAKFSTCNIQKMDAWIHKGALNN